MNVWTYLSIHSFSFYVACVASVSNRVIARKLERKQKKGFLFFCSCPSFLDEPREETLATQATFYVLCILEREL